MLAISEHQFGMKRKTNRILLFRRDLLNSKSIIEEGVAGEVFPDILLDELDTEIRVVDTLDFVSNSADCFGRYE